MDVSTASRPLSQPRPTQAYYVPRRLIEGGRGATNGDDNKVIAEPPRAENGRKSPKETNNNNNSREGNNNKKTNNENNNGNEGHRRRSPKQKSEPQRAANGSNKVSSRPEPRPLMAENIPKPDSLKEKRGRNNRPSPPQSRNEPMAKEAIHSGIVTVSEPRVVSSPSRPLARPNAFSPISPPEKDSQCICTRPDAHVVCKRCGFECSGRVQRVCGQHPMKLSLMDMRECPNPVCRSIQILEM